MTESEQNAFKYAWDWFALHSSQRMQMVSFWLVAVSFLCAAYVQAVSDGSFVVAIGVSLAGSAASIAFVLLDSRTRRLLEIAESALRVLEARIGPEESEVRLIKKADGPRVSFFDSYKTVIVTIESLVAVFFIAGAVYSGIRFAS